MTSNQEKFINQIKTLHIKFLFKNRKQAVRQKNGSSGDYLIQIEFSIYLIQIILSKIIA